MYHQLEKSTAIGTKAGEKKEVEEAQSTTIFLGIKDPTSVILDDWIKIDSSQGKLSESVPDAEAGNKVAQNNQGLCFQFGKYTTRRINQGTLPLELSSREQAQIKTAQEFSNAAAQGDPVSQFKLSDCYVNGKGVVKDEELAGKWLKQAAEQGHPPAQLKLGHCYGDNYFITGHKYGIDSDLNKAVDWYRKAAEQENKDAQHCLGKCYAYGEGVPKDADLAFHWYKKAADHGHMEAQVDLAICYEEGLGVAENKNRAFTMYQKLAGQEESKAQYHFKVEHYQLSAQHRLGVCYAKGHGVGKNEGLAFHWYKKAADSGVGHRGHAIAQLEVARCYENGLGIAENKENAYLYYQKAGNNGSERAKVELERLKNSSPSFRQRP